MNGGKVVRDGFSEKIVFKMKPEESVRIQQGKEKWKSLPKRRGHRSRSFSVKNEWKGQEQKSR